MSPSRPANGLPTSTGAADAIVVGKTNTPEFGLSWLTDNELVGPTTSPVAFSQPLSPGGSSGG